MNIDISDALYTQIKGGTGLRFTLTVGNGEFVMSVKGCQCMRSRKGKLCFFGPSFKMPGPGKWYSPFIVSPVFAATLLEAIEKKYGRHIKLDKEVIDLVDLPNEIEPGLTDNLKL